MKNVFIPNNIEYNELLDYIVFDIKQKYGIDEPQLQIDGVVHDYEDIALWIDQKTVEDKWIKYKHLDGDLFELKTSPPDPSDEVCHKILEDFMNYFKDKYKEVLFKSGSAIYNEDKIRKILFESLKEGYFEIYCRSTPLKDPDGKGRLVFDISVGELSEFHRSYDCGYLTFEIKD